MIDRRLDCLRWRLLAIGGAGLIAGALGLACGGAETVPAQHPTAAREETLDHEPCEGSGHVETLQAAANGKPEIQRVLDGSGRVKCRIVDLDHDGKPDLYEYFDSDGTVRRREFCYDSSGTVNAVEHYEGGKLTKREYDLSGQKRIDTWDWFDPSDPVDPKTGRPAHPVRRERDTNGDGQVDQWWTWNGDKVTIAVDRSGSGKPDPESAIVVGSNGDVLNGPSPGDTPVEPTDGGTPDDAAPASIPTPTAEGGPT